MGFFEKKNKIIEPEIETKDNDKVETQVIAFNKIGEDGMIYGFNMTCRKLYRAKEDEERVDCSIDMVSDEDIDYLISMLTILKEHKE